MRAPVVIAILLVLNVVLGTAWYRATRSTPTLAAEEDNQRFYVISNGPVRVVKTNTFLRIRTGSWQELESTNYEQYVVNLRAFGCPEMTLRDIIVADVNQLYARKRREILENGPDIQWWKYEANSEETQANQGQLRALNEERFALLVKLLGTNWAQNVNAEQQLVRLTGEVLSNMSPEKKQAVQVVVSRSRQAINDYIEQRRMEGEAPDELELSRIREQTRRQLESLMTPQELEEFLLRYSNTAIQMRQEMRGLNLSPDLFRKVFATVDPIDRELQFLRNEEDPMAQAYEKNLEKQRLAALARVLSPEQFEAYRMLNDGDYRMAMLDAQQVGAPALAGQALYEINQAAASETARIRNSDMSDADKQAALKKIEQEQVAARSTLLGLSQPDTATRPQQGSDMYQYRTGPLDTLGGLSLYFKVPLSKLMEANPGIVDGVLPPNQTIKIPSPQPIQYHPGIVPQR